MHRGQRKRRKEGVKEVQPFPSNGKRGGGVGERKFLAPTLCDRNWVGCG